MEHLKCIGAGLLAMALMATAVAVAVAALAVTLEIFDWIQLHHTAMTMPTLYAVAALFVGVIAWLLGRSMRKPT